MKSVKLVNMVKVCLVAASVTLAYNGITAAKDTADSTKTHKMNMQHDHMKMSTEKSNVSNDKEQSIVRKGVIDVKAFDKNKDGKVYQDQMDWNVISDTPGKCPLCKMTLEEVTVKKASENLKKNGFKVKE